MLSNKKKKKKTSNLNQHSKNCRGQIKVTCEISSAFYLHSEISNQKSKLLDFS